MTTIFDETKKIWYGWKREELMDDCVSVGEFALRVMRQKSPTEVCQISHDDCNSSRLLYHEALKQAIKLAKQMRKWHLTSYDVIGILANNNEFLIVIVLAAWFNGLAFHAINPEEKEETIYYLFQKTKPKVIFCDGSQLQKLQTILHTLYPLVCTISNHVAHSEVIRIENLLQDGPSEVIENFCTEPLRDGSDQTMAIVCTSGTTGLPKCVRITNKMCLTDNGVFSENSLTIFSFCTIDWLFGFYGLLANILYGHLRIITTQSYTPEHMAEVITKYQIDCLLTTSHHMTRCVNTQAQRLSSLKFVLMSGSTCYESNLQEIRNALPNATVINIYGTSECGGIAANFGQYKSKSVGQLFSNVELKIVNEATGEKLGPCEIGVLCVKNVYHSTTVPYYGDVGAFYKILDMEDFIITGDLGFMDDEHYLHLSERREIVLKYRNFYYSPHEYEVMIAELEDVMDVCVVGIPNEKQDDVPAAVVVKREGSLLTDCDIVKHVKMHRESQQNFLDYGVFFVKEIPRHHNGKIFIREVVELCRSMRQNKI